MEKRVKLTQMSTPSAASTFLFFFSSIKECRFQNVFRGGNEKGARSTVLLLRSIEDSVKSRVRVLFKSTLSDRILSIAGTSCTCIRRVFDRGSLVLRQFGSVLIGNPKYKYGNGRGNNGVFLYFRVVLDFEAVWYVVFAASTHHWQFRRRYCGCSLFTVVIIVSILNYNK